VLVDVLVDVELEVVAVVDFVVEVAGPPSGARFVEFVAVVEDVASPPSDAVLDEPDALTLGPVAAELEPAAGFDPAAVVPPSRPWMSPPPTTDSQALTSRAAAPPAMTPAPTRVLRPATFIQNLP
jgi:hypothetical protein